MSSRKISWNATLLVGGIFGLAAGAAPNFPALCVLIAFVGFGVGGNLPVDGTLFIEFVPGAYQYLLTLLSVWWAIGQVVSSLIAVSAHDGDVPDPSLMALYSGHSSPSTVATLVSPIAQGIVVGC